MVAQAQVVQVQVDLIPYGKHLQVLLQTVAHQMMLLMQLQPQFMIWK